MNARRCPGCQDKTADTSARGTCSAPQIPSAAANLPDGHTPWTDSVNYAFCDACVDHFKVCQWCGGPLNGYGWQTVPTEKDFCVQQINDNGNHVEGMKVGQQILCNMPVDLFSGKTWRVKRTSYGLREYGQRFWYSGSPYWFWQEIYIDLNLAQSKGEIELEQVSYDWWTGAMNVTASWKITVEVRG